MGWFKQFMGLQAPAAKAQPPSEGPMRLARGKALAFDSTLKLLLDGQTAVSIPPEPVIFSSGQIELGHNAWLSRYYFDDDEFWLQVHSSGEVDGHVESIIVFNYLDSVVITSEAELSRLAGPSSLIGLPTYTLDGVEYQREWGTEAGQTELVGLQERVSGAEQAYTVEHRSMLYARETGLTERREFLLFSVEEDEEGAVSLTTSLGISLYSTDLQVI